MQFGTTYGFAAWGNTLTTLEIKSKSQLKFGENGNDCIRLDSVPGYSAFGTYTGNGSADGNSPFIYLGFRPAFHDGEQVKELLPLLMVY